ncbi:hypothetical protein ABZX39_38465 [Streptomyces collinus]|uniref:hypothetical protein n=1 Tax=Streptomyces collinus TaxID=42684 RepID=UPI0033B77C5E
MNENRSSPSGLPSLLGAAGSGLRRLPGAARAGRIADGALDWITVVSPRGRRIAVYAGAGLLGVAGVVEWPVALTGAAAAWLTQPRRERTARPTTREDGAPSDGRARTPQARSRPAAAAAPGTAPPGKRSAPVPSGPALAPSEPGLASPAEAASRHPGAGARLTPAHFHHHDPRRHDQPAKAGDPATASALKRVAQASHRHA